MLIRRIGSKYFKVHLMFYVFGDYQLFTWNDKNNELE